MQFTYQARNQKGQQQAGTIEASSKESALQILDRHGLYITLLQEASSKPMYARNIRLFDRVSLKEVMLFSRELAIMFRSRVSLLEALGTIGAQMKNRSFREKILTISEDVEGGTALSQALARHPKVFSSFFTQMVKRGEALGKLSDVLDYLADHLEREYALRGKVKGAMVYPLFVLGIAAAVVTLLMVLVLPNLIEVLKESGQELPAMTKVVIAFSDFYKRLWWIAALLGIVVWAGLFRFFKTKRGRRMFHAFVLRAPLFGSLSKMVYITRFGENLSTLIAGGVPIVQALGITGGIVGNEVYEDIILKAKDALTQGDRMSDVLQKYPGQFPSVFTQMVKIGEKSGALDVTLLEIVRFYQKEVDRSIDAFLSILEPLLIVVLGLFVGGLMAAVVVPLYQIGSNFGG